MKHADKKLNLSIVLFKGSLHQGKSKKNGEIMRY